MIALAHVSTQLKAYHSRLANSLVQCFRVLFQVVVCHVRHLFLLSMTTVTITIEPHLDFHQLIGIPLVDILVFPQVLLHLFQRLVMGTNFTTNVSVL